MTTEYFVCVYRNTFRYVLLYHSTQQIHFTARAHPPRLSLINNFAVYCHCEFRTAKVTYRRARGRYIRGTPRLCFVMINKIAIRTAQLTVRRFVSRRVATQQQQQQQHLWIRRVHLARPTAHRFHSTVSPAEGLGHLAHTTWTPRSSLRFRARSPRARPIGALYLCPSG